MSRWTKYILFPNAFLDSESLSSCIAPKNDQPWDLYRSKRSHASASRRLPVRGASALVIEQWQGEDARAQLALLPGGIAYIRRIAAYSCAFPHPHSPLAHLLHHEVPLSRICCCCCACLLLPARACFLSSDVGGEDLLGDQPPLKFGSRLRMTSHGREPLSARVAVFMHCLRSKRKTTIASHAASERPAEGTGRDSSSTSEQQVYIHAVSIDEHRANRKTAGALRASPERPADCTGLGSSSAPGPPVSNHM